jgi:hypothetical protein
MSAGHELMTKPRFSFGVVIGLVAFVLLFAYPAGRFWWPLFAVSGMFTAPMKAERESTKDVSTMALTLGFLAVALLFALFLIPDSFWSGLDIRIPGWAYGETSQGVRTVPMWARVLLAAFWSVVMYRRYKQLENARVEVAV